MRPRNVDQVPSWKNGLVSTLASAPGVGEVGVVALRLAGQRGVQAVVDVVGPLGVQPDAARPPGPAGCTVRRVVAVGLGDQRQRPAELRGEGVDLASTAPPAACSGPVVVQRVHGVQPQRVDVEVAQPLQGVVDDVARAPGR